ncbi:MAG: hypothetical protein KDD50_09650, partial [Bdellovibrionales bacterium]|nr:hypothetical protein [Bdellovibrionales bacterium]
MYLEPASWSRWSKTAESLMSFGGQLFNPPQRSGFYLNQNPVILVQIDLNWSGCRKSFVVGALKASAMASAQIVHFNKAAPRLSFLRNILRYLHNVVICKYDKVHQWENHQRYRQQGCI